VKVEEEEERGREKDEREKERESIFVFEFFPPITTRPRPARQQHTHFQNHVQNNKTERGRESETTV
jgi:hypothetical protein